MGDGGTEGGGGWWCRGAAADVVLEHQSISRQHAALCYNVDRGIWQVLDLGATHGTFVDGRPVVKVDPSSLPPSSSSAQLLPFAEGWACCNHAGLLFRLSRWMLPPSISSAKLVLFAMGWACCNHAGSFSPD